MTWIVTGFEGAGDDRKATLILRERRGGTGVDDAARRRSRRGRRVPRPDLPRPSVDRDGRARRRQAVSTSSSTARTTTPSRLCSFTARGQVDCIYIDPPYNTGASDWKYNNDYVDADDAYRHSKWLAFMERRLKLAKELLNPEDSVLIVTIDEKEYLRLGLLLEQTFPEATIQMVTSSSTRRARRGKEFSRVDEYLFFVMLGDAPAIRSSRCSARRCWITTEVDTDERRDAGGTC